MSDTTATNSRFFGLDINSPYTWPGYPPMSTICRGAELNNYGTTPFDTSQPIAFQGNPKFYYKWLRIIPRTNSGWNRNIYLPAGTESPIMLDRVFMPCSGDQTGDHITDVCAWTLFISRPDNQDCVITTYDPIDPELCGIQDTSAMIRANYRPQDRVQRFNCQDGGKMELSPDNAQEVGSWSMSQGSVVFSTGNYYFKLANTGTTDQTIVTLASFNNYDLKDVLESPVVTTQRPFIVNWTPN